MDGTDPIVADARALPGVDDVTFHYRDPDGNEHPEPPGTPADREGWTLRLDIVHGAEYGAGWAAEAIDELLEGRPEPTTPALEIWLHPVTPTASEIAVRAYPRTDDGSQVRDAFLLAATPGVVRAVFDGETADVRVADAADLAKVADVAAVQGTGVDVIRVLGDDSAEVRVADVPPRPPYVPSTDRPAQRPADPAAPDCDPASLRLELTGTDAALGSRYLFLGATNTGAAPCALRGRPELTFRTLAEEPLAVAVTPSTTPPDPPRLVVPPGARAVAMLDWNAMPTANDPNLTYEVLLAAGDGAPATELPLTSLVIDGAGPQTSLDIVDGGEVAVTAWQPDGTGF
ncbi:DUF4232 domain-containing protein [Jiangella ureilytica]|uniref:DUF4232 domain-containing protein n=2 Tax=Jiangella ureilytica TaxID=2530374 RepID=A0A4R4RUW2_9ACTN|nr:DUF4232 domain-containing protein [Jiangella ureilytica]